MVNKMKSFKPDPKSRYKQGYFIPKNPSKYIGDITKIIYRSGLELKFCKFCDTSDRISRWASEPIAIKYYNPVSKTIRNYYPDYLVRFKTIDGSAELPPYLIEVKASNMLKMPNKPKRPTEKRMKSWYNISCQVIVNIAKCKAAEIFCEEKGFKYTFLTETFFKP
jgi:hypothetical protein